MSEVNPLKIEPLCEPVFAAVTIGFARSRRPSGPSSRIIRHDVRNDCVTLRVTYARVAGRLSLWLPTYNEHNENVPCIFFAYLYLYISLSLFPSILPDRSACRIRSIDQSIGMNPTREGSLDLSIYAHRSAKHKNSAANMHRLIMSRRYVHRKHRA